MTINYFLNEKQREKLNKSQENILEHWNKSEKKPKKTEEQLGYTINTYMIETGPKYWSYVMYEVVKDDKVLCQIFRNYSWGIHQIIRHPNGNDYFFTGHDYQGYTIVNLTQDSMGIYMHDHTEEGFGWCPADFHGLDESTLELTIEGCYWAAPYELRTLDFSNPDILPLSVLKVTDVDGGHEYDQEDLDDVNGVSAEST